MNLSKQDFYFAGYKHPSPDSLPYPPSNWLTNKTQHIILKKLHKIVKNNKKKLDNINQKIKSCTDFNTLLRDHKGHIKNIYSFLNQNKEELFFKWKTSSNNYFTFYDNMKLYGQIL